MHGKASADLTQYASGAQCVPVSWLPDTDSLLQGSTKEDTSSLQCGASPRMEGWSHHYGVYPIPVLRETVIRVKPQGAEYFGGGYDVDYRVLLAFPR